MRLRVLRNAVLAGVVAMLAVTGSAAASTGSATDYQVRGCAGVYPCWTGDFFARWTYVKANLAGTYFWEVTQLSMSDTVELGQDCSPEICASWSAGAHILFLNASGQQVGVELSPPQVGTCNPTVGSPRSEYWGYCRPGPYFAPITATRVEVLWDVYMEAASNGFDYPVFTLVKYVPLS